MKRPGGFLVFISCVLLFSAVVAPRMMQVNQLKARSRQMEEELRRLQFENRVLENELRLLRDDPVYLEKVARGKLNKAKEGEIVYKVVHAHEA